MTLRLNPHLYAVVLDGAYHEEGSDLAWEGLGHLMTSEVGDVLERAVRRIEIKPQQETRPKLRWAA